MLASWELPKILSDLDIALFFNFPVSNGSFPEVPGTSLPWELPKSWQIGNFPKSLRILTWHYFSTSLWQWEVSESSGNFLGNFQKCWQVVSHNFLLLFQCTPFNLIFLFLFFCPFSLFFPFPYILLF